MAKQVRHIGPRRPFRLYIREWIEHKGLDQKTVAERMECEPGTLSKLISGQMRRTDDWLAGIAYALNIEVPDLYRHPERPTRDDLLRDVPDDRREFIERVVTDLLKSG